MITKQIHISYKEEKNINKKILIKEPQNYINLEQENFYQIKLKLELKKDEHVINCTLTEQDIIDVWNKQNKCDYYTGESLEDNIGMSVDRIDSSGIYEKKQYSNNYTGDKQNEKYTYS